MATFSFIWVGKASRKQPEQEICDRYLKRMGGFLRVEERILKPASSQARERDSELILQQLKPQDVVILCDERGKQLSSPGLATFIERQFQSGVSNLTWIIGGSMGVNDALRQRANLVLAFSKMTFPHALARMMLYEQTYRALCLRANHPYHHGA